jgi:hypothetical protein
MIAMRPILAVWAGASALLSAGACRAAPVRQELPAVVEKPSPRSRAEIAAAVSAALGAPVRLSDDVLTRESTLVIERERRLDPSGLPAQGRERGPPARFRLVKIGGECVLVHEATGQRFLLKETTCSPV